MQGGQRGLSFRAVPLRTRTSRHGIPMFGQGNGGVQNIYLDRGEVYP
jgi:hypothetical protein